VTLITADPQVRMAAVTPTPAPAPILAPAPVPVMSAADIPYDPVPPVPDVNTGRANGCARQAGDPALNVAAGDILGDRLREWAKGMGYTLFWDGEIYRADGALYLNKGVDDTLADFRDAMQQSGINLNVKIYNNCVIRVVEVR
jgi:hypothetical protein